MVKEGFQEEVPFEQRPEDRGGVTGDKENMQPHEVGGSPMSPCHSPFALQAAGLAAGVCLVSPVGAS